MIDPQTPRARRDVVAASIVVLFALLGSAYAYWSATDTERTRTDIMLAVDPEPQRAPSPARSGQTAAAELSAQPLVAPAAGGAEPAETAVRVPEAIVAGDVPLGGFDAPSVRRGTAPFTRGNDFTGSNTIRRNSSAGSSGFSGGSMGGGGAWGGVSGTAAAQSETSTPARVVAGVSARADAPAASRPAPAPRTRPAPSSSSSSSSSGAAASAESAPAPVSAPAPAIAAAPVTAAIAPVTPTVVAGATGMAGSSLGATTEEIVGGAAGRGEPFGAGGSGVLGTGGPAPAPTPEPLSMMLMGSGLAGLYGLRKYLK